MQNTHRERVCDEERKRQRDVYFGVVDKMFYEHDEHKKRQRIAALTAVTNPNFVNFVHSKWLFWSMQRLLCAVHGCEYMCHCTWIYVHILIFIAFNANGIYYIYIFISLVQRDMISPEIQRYNVLIFGLD